MKFYILHNHTLNKYNNLKNHQWDHLHNNSSKWGLHQVKVQDQLDQDLDHQLWELQELTNKWAKILQEEFKHLLEGQ